MMNPNTKILYVEDNPGQSYLLRKRMEEVGVQIDCASAFPEALEMAKGKHYDLYIVDYVIGNYNGIDLIAEFKLLDHFAPSLILTASGNEEVAVKALKSGAYDYVIKDVDTNYLGLMPSKVEQVLKVRRNELKEFEVQRELKLAAQVFEHTIEGILVTDSQGIIKKVNPAFTKITGYSPEEAIGKKTNILRSHHHDQEFYKKLWDSLLTQGKWEGEIWNRRKSGEMYPQWMTISAVFDEKGKILQFASLFHDITELKQHERTMEYHAYHDPLTCLPNRLLFMDHLQMALGSAKRRNTLLAVMFMDLDGFKAINDLHGHAIGDVLLQEVAKRLREVMRDEDTVSRFGGDEFTLLFQDVIEKADAVSLAERIIETVTRPMDLKGKSAQVGISIGIALFPTDGDTENDLIQKADVAMYEVKQSGKNNFAFFTKGMKGGVRGT